MILNVDIYLTQQSAEKLYIIDRIKNSKITSKRSDFMMLDRLVIGLIWQEIGSPAEPRIWISTDVTTNRTSSVRSTARELKTTTVLKYYMLNYYTLNSSTYWTITYWTITYWTITYWNITYWTITYSTIHTELLHTELLHTYLIHTEV